MWVKPAPQASAALLEVQAKWVRLAWVRPAQSARLAPLDALDALARKVKMASMVKVIQDLRGPLEA